MRDRRGRLVVPAGRWREIDRQVLRAASRAGGLRPLYYSSPMNDRRTLRLWQERKLQDVSRNLATRRNVPLRAAPPPTRLGVAGLDVNLTAVGDLAQDLGRRVTSGHGGGLRNELNLARALLVETPRAYVEQRGAPLKADAQFLLDAATGLVKAPFAVARGQGGELVEGLKADLRTGTRRLCAVTFRRSGSRSAGRAACRIWRTWRRARRGC